jgi:dUTP pyrophosphatase
MKLKIKIKLHNNLGFPQRHGEWIDLILKDDITLQKGQYSLLDLGVSMKLPEGFEAYILPRSSTFKNYKLLQTNSMGVVDNAYSGNEDIYKFPVLCMTKEVTIPAGTRICQFRITLSQGATVMQKLKWLFSDGVELEVVSSLDSVSRGGFGSSGKF